jgi:hypothetical protein
MAAHLSLPAQELEAPQLRKAELERQQQMASTMSHRKARGGMGGVLRERDGAGMEHQDLEGHENWRKMQSQVRRQIQGCMTCDEPSEPMESLGRLAESRICCDSWSPQSFLATAVGRKTCNDKARLNTTLQRNASTLCSNETSLHRC